MQGHWVTVTCLGLGLRWELSGQHFQGASPSDQAAEAWSVEVNMKGSQEESWREEGSREAFDNEGSLVTTHALHVYELPA